MLLEKMYDAVSKLQNIDPAYKAPQLKKVKSLIGCPIKGCCFFVIGLIALVFMSIVVANLLSL
jgi:hypothetical protein